MVASVGIVPGFLYLVAICVKFVDAVACGIAGCVILIGLAQLTGGIVFKFHLFDGAVCVICVGGQGLVAIIEGQLDSGNHIAFTVTVGDGSQALMIGIVFILMKPFQLTVYEIGFAVGNITGIHHNIKLGEIQQFAVEGRDI
jgi:hypothetical protein